MGEKFKKGSVLCKHKSTEFWKIGGTMKEWDRIDRSAT